MKTMYRVVAIGILVAVSAHHASATPLIGNPGGTVSGAGAGYSLGYRFVVGSNNLSVDALGIWDHDTDGLSVAHDVAIYTDAGTQLAVATVPAGLGGTPIGEYLYTSIAPIILTSGTAYRLSASFGTSEDYMNTGATFSVDPSASSYSSFGAYYVISGSVAFPTVAAGSGGYIGPNLNFSLAPAPEPNSVILACLGLAGVLRLVRRRVVRKF